jgi:hypothetical protein
MGVKPGLRDCLVQSKKTTRVTAFSIAVFAKVVKLFYSVVFSKE